MERRPFRRNWDDNAKVGTMMVGHVCRMCERRATEREYQTKRV